MRTNREIKTLMSGILLGESPRWHDGRLWFADWVAQKLYAVDEVGHSATIAEIASLPFSIDWLPDGRLLIVNASNNTLMSREADGHFVTHADLSPLSKFGCNEIVVDGRGNIFVNSPNEDMPEGPGPAYEAFLKTGARPGIIGVVMPDGAVRKVANGLAFPNGMAVTPDNKTLIVAESFSGALTAFDIGADGSLSNQRLWAQLNGQGGDGLCLDAEGAVWVGSGPRCVRVAEGGEELDEVRTDRMCFACMLGGADGKTLFITANEWGGDIAGPESDPTGRLYAVRVDVPHAGYPKAD